MRRFLVICRMECVLFARDFFGVFFTLAFPLLMLLLYGGIYGNGPLYPGAEVGVMDASVPAYAVMIMGVTGLMTFPLTLAEYKEKKIYKRFDATPAGKGQVILAQVAVHAAMTFLGFALLLAAGKALYRVEIRGDALSVIAAMLVSAAAMFSMGFLFAAAGRDSKITNLLCYLTYFVMIFLSGATMPDMLFPDSIKAVAKLLPMTYAVDLVQGVFGGSGLAAHTLELLVLGGLTAVCAGAGAFLYRRKDWR